MDLQLSGKRALVTGSTAGIGEAIARTLAAEGVAVTIHGRDVARGRAVAEQIAREGGRAHFVAGDLTRTEDLAQVAAEARRAFGGVDILVNNAAVYPQHTWLESPAADWAKLYDINVVAAVQLIQRLVPEMKASGWGRVVQISSGEGTRPFAHMPGYAATKAAVNNMTSSLCLALAGSGVTVNSV